MFKKKWILLFSVVLNSGGLLSCSEHKKPHVDIPSKWPAQYSTQTKKSVDLPDLHWWKQFKNEELNGLIQKSLQKNNQVHLAIANIESAQNQLQAVKLSWLPNLSILAGYSQLPIFGNAGSMLIASPEYIVNIFQLYQQQKSAKAKLEARVYAQYCARLSVIAQTAASFFTLMAQNEALGIYQHLAEKYQIYLKLAQSQYRSDLINLDQITQIESQIQQIKAQIKVARHNILVTQNALHFLLNENPGNIKIKTAFKNVDSDAFIPGNLPASVLSTRPDVLKAEALLKSAHADVGAMKANLLPEINLGAYLGKAGNTEGTLSLGQAYVDAPIVDLPLYSNIKVSQAHYKAMYIKYIETIRGALRDVANDLSAYSVTSQQLSHNQVAFKNEKKRCQLANIRYRHGIADQISLTQCQIKLDEFALIINQNKLEKMLSMVTLYQDLGGGYHGH